MKPTSTRFNSIVFQLNLSPAHLYEIKYPKIAQIISAFSSKHHQIWKFKLSYMVSSFPWSHFAIIWYNFKPLFGFPVQKTDCIEPLFAWSTSPEYNQLIILLIVANWTVWSSSWNVPRGLNFSPLLCFQIIRPQVIHIVSVWINELLLIKPPNTINSSPIVQQACPHLALGFKIALLAISTECHSNWDIFIS